MRIVQCSKKHFYDKDKFDECPLCKGKKEIIYKDFKLCPECSTKNPANHKYCYNCGNALTQRAYVKDRIDVYICVIHHRLKNEFSHISSKNNVVFIAYCGKIYLNSLDCYDENNHISVKINKDLSSLLINYKNDYKELSYEFNQLIKYDVLLYDAMESWDIIISDSEIDFREYLKGYTAIRGNLYVLNEPVTQSITTNL